MLLPVWLDLSLWDIIQNLRPVPLAVIVLLILFSLLSWTIVFSKGSVFSRARQVTIVTSSAHFVRQITYKLSQSPVSSLPRRLWLPYSTLVMAKSSARSGNVARSLVNKPAVERSLQLGISEEVTKLEMNMSWLATVASVSPFIGLFGTVWGIIDAFQALGNVGAPAFGQSRRASPKRSLQLQSGLAAAIPAAIFYNVFGNRIKEIGTRMEDFAIEFQNLAERDFGG